MEEQERRPISSQNWYAYVHNDPANCVDLWGLKPGDLFDSIADAVNDFAVTYNDDSIRDKVELGTTIYKDSSGKFYYPSPNIGTETGINFYTPSYRETDTSVALVHTHSNYLDEGGEVLSKKDISTGELFNLPVYAVTPGGKIQEHIPGSGLKTQNTLPTNPKIASDPKAPNRVTSVDPKSGTVDVKNCLGQETNIDILLDEQDRRQNMTGSKDVKCSNH